MEKNKVDMKLLKETFERVGMEKVVTYINTGNIIFHDPFREKNEIANLLEEAIDKDFGLQIKVLIRNLDDFHVMMQSIPDSWRNDKQMKSDVMFLWEEVDHEGILDQLVIKPEIDHVNYVSGALLWSVDKANVTKSGMMKLVGNKVYKKMTIRNVNTTRKIYELMASRTS